MFGELEIRIINLERKVGIQYSQNKSYEERRLVERKQEKHQWKKNKEKREQDRLSDSEEEQNWINDHDYDY